MLLTLPSKNYINCLFYRHFYKVNKVSSSKLLRVTLPVSGGFLRVCIIKERILANVFSASIKDVFLPSTVKCELHEQIF